jgi:hypothetical protein
MGKTQINMRVDDDLLTEFNTQRNFLQLTQVEYLEKIINDISNGGTTELLKVRLGERDLEIIRLNIVIERFEKLTGKKMPKLRSVTFKVTDEEFNNLTDLSHKTQIPKTHLFSKFFSKLKSRNELPQLTDKNI